MLMIQSCIAEKNQQQWKWNPFYKYLDILD